MAEVFLALKLATRIGLNDYLVVIPDRFMHEIIHNYNQEFLYQ